MKPTKEETARFLAWLSNPPNKEQAARVMDEISDAIQEILHKNHILD